MIEIRLRLCLQEEKQQDNNITFIFLVDIGLGENKLTNILIYKCEYVQVARTICIGCLDSFLTFHCHSAQYCNKNYLCIKILYNWTFFVGTLKPGIHCL